MSDHPPQRIRIVEHADRARLSAAVADEQALLIASACGKQGRAILVMPGGQTPRAALAELAERPLPWARVCLVPGDERIVPADHRLSNAKGLSQCFNKTRARIIPLVAGEIRAPHLMAEQATARLARLSWPVDGVWLGMGDDGHVASLFPMGMPVAAFEASRMPLAVAGTPEPLPPEAPVARITLSLETLCATRSILLTMTGWPKRTLLDQALAGDPMATTLPIGRLLARAAALHRPLTVHWAP